MYLSYDDYKNMGGTLELTAFNRLNYRANGILESATKKRLSKDTGPVKAVCFEIIEYLRANENNGQQISSKSQSAGNVSESETYTNKTVEDMKTEIEDLIFDYLGEACDILGRPLLYRGGLY